MTARRKKRPKSVFAKGWATRRRNQELLNGPGEKIQGIAAIPATPESNADPRNPNMAQSPIDAIARTLDMHRDEQLCCFLAEMSTMRRTGALQGHFPIMLSRSQAEAIEGWLTEYGYSPFGRRTEGCSSTAPTTKAA